MLVQPGAGLQAVTLHRLHVRPLHVCAADSAEHVDNVPDENRARVKSWDAQRRDPLPLVQADVVHLARLHGMLGESVHGAAKNIDLAADQHTAGAASLFYRRRELGPRVEPRVVAVHVVQEAVVAQPANGVQVVGVGQHARAGAARGEGRGRLPRVGVRNVLQHRVAAPPALVGELNPAQHVEAAVERAGPYQFHLREK